jgi:hypothetical protein
MTKVEVNEETMDISVTQFENFKELYEVIIVKKFIGLVLPTEGEA